MTSEVHERLLASTNVSISINILINLNANVNINTNIDQAATIAAKSLGVSAHIYV